MINHPYEVSKALVRINVVLTHCPGASLWKEEIATQTMNSTMTSASNGDSNGHGSCGENTVKYVQIEDGNSR